MVAPIDAKSSFEAEGETYTLRLNFRSISLAEDEGIDVLAGKALTATKVAVLLRCLAVQEHPDLTDDDAFAIVFGHGDKVGAAITELFAKFGGKPSAEGKAPAARPKKARPTA